MIKLVENYFRGKKKSVIAEELPFFCEEHGLKERDVKTIIRKMYLPKRKKDPSIKTKRPSRRKSKVINRLLNNQDVLNILLPKKKKERYHPPQRKRTWSFIKEINKWVSTVVADSEWVRPTKWLKSGGSLPIKVARKKSVGRSKVAFPPGPMTQMSKDPKKILFKGKYIADSIIEGLFIKRSQLRLLTQT